jgi:DNA topoisomerase VI subunit B
MERADHAPKGKYYTTQLGELVQMIKFDVAVTTERSSDAKAGGGIRVAGIGFGGDLAASDKDTSLSRVSFEVPVTFPRKKVEG